MRRNCCTECKINFQCKINIQLTILQFDNLSWIAYCLLIIVSVNAYNPQGDNKCKKCINLLFICSLSFGGPMVVNNGNSDGLIIYDQEARAIL